MWELLGQLWDEQATNVLPDQPGPDLPLLVPDWEQSSQSPVIPVLGHHGICS